MPLTPPNKNLGTVHAFLNRQRQDPPVNGNLKSNLIYACRLVVGYAISNRSLDSFTDTKYMIIIIF